MKRRPTRSAWIGLSGVAAFAAAISLLGLGCGDDASPGGVTGADAQRLLVETRGATSSECRNGGVAYTLGYDTSGDGGIDDVVSELAVCNGAEGAPLIVSTRDAASDACPGEGVEYRFGYDLTGDGSIDETIDTFVFCEGETGADGRPVLIETGDATLDACPNGGTTYVFGYDNTMDGEIDEVLSSSSMCHGTDGTNGIDGVSPDELQMRSSFSSTEECPTGGVVYVFGYDRDGDGALDDVLSTEIICNGEDGADGADGATLHVMSAPASAADCPHGGVSLSIGYDRNGDDDIDDVIVTRAICDGADGAAGASVLVDVGPADASECPDGGSGVTLGYDQSGDGQIDDITASYVTCNGADGVDGDALLAEASAASFAECPQGGVALRLGYDRSGDGAIDETVSTSVVCNGADGDDGEDGEDGAGLLVEWTRESTSDHCAAHEIFVVFGYDRNGDGAIDEVISSDSFCEGVSAVRERLFGKQVVYYSADPASDHILTGLRELHDDGIIFLEEVLPGAGIASFGTRLNSAPSFDIAFGGFSNQSVNAPFIANVQTYLADGGRIILTDWTRNATLNAVMNAENASSAINQTSIDIFGEIAGRELPSPLQLANLYSWGTYTMPYAPVAGGESVCTFVSSGHSCMVRGNGGRSLLVGFLNGTFDPALGRTMAENQLMQVLAN